MSIIDTQIYIISDSSPIQILQYSVTEIQREAEISCYFLPSAGTLPNPQDGIWLLKKTCLQDSNQTKFSSDRNCN